MGEEAWIAVHVAAVEDLEAAQGKRAKGEQFIIGALRAFILAVLYLHL